MLSLLLGNKRLSDRKAGESALCIAPDVKASPNANGVVLIHLGKGTVFSANRVGAIIWNGLGERRSLEKMAEAISAEFHIPPQTAHREAVAFLAQLQAEGLLIPDAD
jgi:hypothetical protein